MVCLISKDTLLVCLNPLKQVKAFGPTLDAEWIRDFNSRLNPLKQVKAFGRKITMSDKYKSEVLIP